MIKPAQIAIGKRATTLYCSTLRFSRGFNLMRVDGALRISFGCNLDGGSSVAGLALSEHRSPANLLHDRAFCGLEYREILAVNRLRLALRCRNPTTNKFSPAQPSSPTNFFRLRVLRCAAFVNDAARAFTALSDSDKAAIGATYNAKGKKP
jgi:hypothetical protein